MSYREAGAPGRSKESGRINGQVRMDEPGRTNTPRRHILLVADEEGFALQQRTLLEDHGFKVTTVHSGEAAVEAVEQACRGSDTGGPAEDAGTRAEAPEPAEDAGGERSGIDLVLLDIGLGPGMDGTEAARRILSRHTLPIVFLTGRTAQEDLDQVADITGYGYVLKGSGDRILLQSIRTALELFDAQRDAAAKEDRLHQIIDDAPIGIYESWEDGSFRSMNREMARLLGFDAVDAAMAHYGDLARQFYVDPDRRGQLFATLDREGVVQDFEVDAVNALGQHLTLRTNARVLARDPERGMLISGFLVDETRRRRAENALSRSLEQYRSVVRLAQEIIVRSDADGVWTFLNNEASRFFGMGREELVGRRFLDFVHPDDRAAALESGRTMRETRRSVEGVVNRQWTPRGWRYVEWNSAPILDEKGAFNGLQSTGRDISDQRRLQEQWRALFEQATVGVVLFSAEQLVVQANPYAAQMLGYTPEELTALSSSDVLHPDDLATESTRTAIDRMDESDERLQRELRLRRKDGGYMHALVSMKRFHSLRDDVRYVAMFYDISERIEAESRLQQALDEKDALMAELNHRVKNNLSMVAALVGLKDEALGNDVDLSDIIQHIDAVRAVHELLHRADSVTEVPLRSYLQELMESAFTPKAGEAVRIENDVADIAVPAKTATVLGLIVNELAINAMKYGFTTDTTPRFRVGLYEEAGSADGRGDGAAPEGSRGRAGRRGSAGHRGRPVLFTVSNSGRPFPEEVTLDNPTTLGLQLVTGLVSQLSGSIELTRSPEPRFAIRFSLGG